MATAAGTVSGGDRVERIAAEPGAIRDEGSGQLRLLGVVAGIAAAWLPDRAEVQRRDRERKREARDRRWFELPPLARLADGPYVVRRYHGSAMGGWFRRISLAAHRMR